MEVIRPPHRHRALAEAHPHQQLSGVDLTRKSEADQRQIPVVHPPEATGRGVHDAPGSSIAIKVGNHSP